MGSCEFRARCVALVRHRRVLAFPIFGSWGGLTSLRAGKVLGYIRLGLPVVLHSGTPVLFKIFLVAGIGNMDVLSH